MKNKLFTCSLSLVLLAGAGVLGAWAQEKAKAKFELVEKQGVIEVIKANPANKEKYDTILLKVGEETFKLLPGEDKKAFKPLGKLDGKTVTVTGRLLPANPPKYPLAAIKVASVLEAAAPVKKSKK